MVIVMIGIILKNARVSASLSQKELGNKLYLADTTISSYERGNSQPDFEMIVRILKICGYEIQFINAKDNITRSLEQFSREI